MDSLDANGMLHSGHLDYICQALKMEDHAHHFSINIIMVLFWFPSLPLKLCKQIQPTTYNPTTYTSTFYTATC